MSCTRAFARFETTSSPSSLNASATGGVGSATRSRRLVATGKPAGVGRPMRAAATSLGMVTWMKDAPPRVSDRTGAAGRAGTPGTLRTPGAPTAGIPGTPGTDGIPGAAGRAGTLGTAGPGVEGIPGTAAAGGAVTTGMLAEDRDVVNVGAATPPIGTPLPTLGMAIVANVVGMAPLEPPVSDETMPTIVAMIGATAGGAARVSSNPSQSMIGLIDRLSINQSASPSNHNQSSS